VELKCFMLASVIFILGRLIYMASLGGMILGAAMSLVESFPVILLYLYWPETLV